MKDLLFEYLIRFSANAAGRIVLFFRHRSMRKIKEVLDAEYNGSYTDAGLQFIGRPLHNAALLFWLLLFIVFIGGIFGLVLMAVV